MSQENHIREDVGPDFLDQAFAAQSSPQQPQQHASREDRSSPRPANTGKTISVKFPSNSQLNIPNVAPLSAPTPLGRLRKAKKKPWTSEIAGLYLDENFSNFF